MRYVRNEFSDGLVRYAGSITYISMTFYEWVESVAWQTTSWSIPPEEKDSPRTRTTRKTKTAKNKDLISPLPCMMSDHWAIDLRREMMPRRPKDKVMRRMKEKESRLFERVLGEAEAGGGVARVSWLVDSVLLEGTTRKRPQG